jgi:flagellar basal-body rod protein FlgB
MSRPVEDALIGQLRATLDRLSLRATAAASNLANVDTPGYTAVRASFPETLGRVQRLEMARTDSGHVGPASGPSAKGTLEQAPVTKARADGNTVDLDREMTALAQVQGRYAAATRIVRKRFALLRYAATDGRG